MAGCPNFNPTSELTNEDLCKKKKWLQKEFRLSEKQRNKTKIDLVLNKTYSAQREFLVQTPTPSLQMLQTEWPFLFECKYIKWHFQKLCQLEFSNKDIQNRMVKIHNFLMDGETSQVTNDNELIKSTLDELFKYFKIKASKGEEPDFYSILEVVFFCISQLFVYCLKLF